MRKEGREVLVRASRRSILWPIWAQKPVFRPSAWAPNFFEPKWATKSLRYAHHYYAVTTPILTVPRPILFHSVSLECICNLGRCHSIYWPRNVGCQIGCIGIDRRQMRRFWQKKHISQKALFHHDASHGILLAMKQPLQYLQHPILPKILCWIRFWRRRGLNLNGYGCILTLTQDM